jgi:hypothetical protein
MKLSQAVRLAMPNPNIIMDNIVVVAQKFFIGVWVAIREKQT